MIEDIIEEVIISTDSEQFTGEVSVMESDPLWRWSGIFNTLVFIGATVWCLWWWLSPK